MKQYNVKVRKCGDYREWEELRLLSFYNRETGQGEINYPLESNQLKSLAESFIADDPVHIHEVRINEVGSQMGDYFKNKNPQRNPHTTIEKEQHFMAQILPGNTIFMGFDDEN